MQCYILWGATRQYSIMGDIPGMLQPFYLGISVAFKNTTGPILLRTVAWRQRLLSPHTQFFKPWGEEPFLLPCCDPKADWALPAFLKQQKSQGKLAMVSLRILYHLVVPLVQRTAEIQSFDPPLTRTFQDGKPLYPRGLFFSHKLLSYFLCIMRGSQTPFLCNSYLMVIMEPGASMG